MTRFFRRFRAIPAPQTSILPKPSAELPGTRLATLRAVAAHTGWGAGIEATAALVGAVCQQEDTRIATIAAPLVAVASALAGYEVVTYGEEPPVRPVPTIPLTWGASEIVSPRKRFDAVAVDATTNALAPLWLNEVFARITFRSGRTQLAILCTATDAAAYMHGCHFVSWDVYGLGTDAGMPPVVLLTSVRFRLLGGS